MTAIGELNRMHQFRDKSVAQRELVSAGLLFYPVLQAADVLAYRANEVPVGEDQREHLELMRDVARRFNARFGDTLVVPEHRIPDGRRARRATCRSPSARCRRRAAPSRARCYVLDEPDAIVKKFRRAVTDSGQRDRPRARQAGRDQPDRDPRRRARRGAGGGRAPTSPACGYGDLKGAVGDAVAAWLAPVRERYEELRADEAALEDALAAGAEKARAIASATLADVRAAMGVGPVRRPSLR